MTVDSGNVSPDVYAPTVEFTLAANAGRDLQAATDADHDAFLGCKSAAVAFCFKTLRGPSNDTGSAGWRIYRRPVSGRKTSVDRA